MARSVREVLPQERIPAKLNYNTNKLFNLNWLDNYFAYVNFEAFKLKFAS
jgi:hypothetical protein